jgi:hypothetical protein
MKTVARFGEREDVALWRVEGVKSDEFLRELGGHLAKLLDMHILDGPLMHTFTEGDGQGAGTGAQYYWVWGESFLVISTWPALGFTRIYLASCKQFHPVLVTKFLEAAVGEVQHFRYAEI